jgi:hypothetical protein
LRNPSPGDPADLSLPEVSYRQIRNVTKSKWTFTSVDALMKLLFLAQQNICSEWNNLYTTAAANRWN